MTAYLDNSATTRPTEGVIEAMNRCMREGFYNPSSLYAPAIDVEKSLRACRQAVARALRGDEKGVYFTSGGTEGNNLCLIGSVSAMRGKQTVIVSAVEHPSVLEACAELERQGHEVIRLGVDIQGQPDFDELEKLLERKPALVSCMQVNNETGAMPDIRRLSALVRAASPATLIHVDGVQGFMREPFDVRLVDMYTLSGHKIHGPKGVGAVYIRPGVRVLPRQLGGGQEKSMRSGTENTPGIAGLERAIMGMSVLDDAHDLLMKKKLRFWTGIQAAVPEAKVNGPEPDQGAGHIINVTFPGVRGEVMLHALEERGVYCSTGSACSSKKRHISPVLTAMGVPADEAEGALRFSLSPHTADDEIDAAVSVIGPLYDTLRRYKRR
ncbi:MAG: cysteine desulfurase [Clostridia bacterium]|nr:cysteine desulfurase [Clostridia bacterium]